SLDHCLLHSFPTRRSSDLAAILVIFFYPMHERLVRKFSATKAAVISTVAVTILLIVPAIFVTTLFVREAVSISRGVQHSIAGERAEERRVGRSVDVGGGRV